MLASAPVKRPAHASQLHPLVPLPDEVRALLETSDGLQADHLIAAFTRAQAGVVARRQLLGAGVTQSEIDWRLKRHRLIVRHRGVFSIAHPHLTAHGQRTAAVLAVLGSFLSHRSATALHGASSSSAGGAHHVTVRSRSGRHGLAGLRVHASASLTDSDVCVVEGLPCTSLSRSIVDAADYATRPQIANMLAASERAGSLDIAATREVLDRVRGRPTRGHALLTEVLDEHSRIGAQLTRSGVEAALRSVAVKAGLPAPQMNRVLYGEEIDAVWPDVRLGIEIDSWEFHRDRRSFVADRAKLRRLFLRGYVVLPYAAVDIVHRPDLVAAELAAARERAAETRLPVVTHDR